MTYTIYHIPGVKIGCTANLEVRMKWQGFTEWQILEEHTDIYIASDRELELQKQYGYKVDDRPYWKSRERLMKAVQVSKETKNEWLSKVDWKAREEKINQKEKWDKVKSSPNYINLDRRSIGLKSQKNRIKPLLQYDLDGNFIKEWNMSSRAMKNTPYPNARFAAQKRSKSKTMYGFKWKYKESDIIEKKIEKFENKSFKKVIQKDLDGNVIKIWDNQTQAAKSLGCTTTLINRVCNGLAKTAKGYKWERI